MEAQTSAVAMRGARLLMRPAVVRVRWRIFAFLFGFGFLAYVQQKSLTVAAERMMPDLGLSQVQIGWLEQAFVLGYAAFQVPSAIFGQHVGARRAFVITGLTALLATLATPVLPSLLAGQGLFAALLGAQILLGFAQAAVFPVSAGVIEKWFPSGRWAFVQGVQTMGLGFGAALTPPLIASLMHAYGWQRALFWTTLPGVVVVALWGWYGRNTPREHPAVTAAELAEIGTDHASPVDAAIGPKQILRLITNRNVAFLAFSYLCMNYSFYLLSNWVFLYLVEERHFSVLESGWLASAPPLAAALGAGVGGVLTGILCQRLGNRWGFRLVPLLAMPAVGALLLVAVNAANAYFAVAVLAFCFGCVELTEGAFWGGAMTVGRGDTMAVSGFMNTGGNMGGIVGIPIVAYLSGHQQWHAAFLIGAAFAVVSALAWLFIDVAHPVEVPHPVGSDSPASGG